MDVSGTGGTTTLVTVDVGSTTTLRQPGYSSAALANIVAGDQVSVSGTQAGTATLGATSVTLPEVRETGSVVTAPGAAPTTQLQHGRERHGGHHHPGDRGRGQHHHLAPARLQLGAPWPTSWPVTR